MKKVLLISLTCLSSLLPASASLPSFTSSYGELGLGPFPLPLPVFGLGMRGQRGHQGWDASVQVSSIVCLTHVKGSFLYHHYFNPCLESQFYAGAGVSAGALFGGETLPLFSPEFVFGKHYVTETGGGRFFQVRASFPTLHESDVFYMPLVVLSYGVLF